MGTETKTNELIFNKINLTDLAKQICLIDLKLFINIPISELDSFDWTSRTRKQLCPNLMKFTRQFNLINMWAINEILKDQDQKDGKVLAKFIKLTKKLVDLRNYHSSYALKSALSSAPIHRLKNSWTRLSRKQTLLWESLEQLFSLDDNQQRLREEIKPTKLPLIPYMGIYLGDLTMLDTAHPKIKGNSTDIRKDSLQKVYNDILYFQLSVYSFKEQAALRSYILSQEYIDELQNLIIDGYFYKSKQLEPDQDTDSNNSNVQVNGSSLVSSSDGNDEGGTHVGNSAFYNRIIGDTNGACSTLKFSKIDRFNVSHRKCKSWESDQGGSYRPISDEERQQHNWPVFTETAANIDGSIMSSSSHESSCYDFSTRPPTSPQISSSSFQQQKKNPGKIIVRNLLDDSEIFSNQSNSPLVSSSGGLVKSISVKSNGANSNVNIKHMWQAADSSQMAESPLAAESCSVESELIFQGCLTCQRKSRNTIALSPVITTPPGAAMTVNSLGLPITSQQKYLVKLWHKQLECFISFYPSKVNKPKKINDFKLEYHLQIDLLSIDLVYNPTKVPPKIILLLPKERISLKYPSGNSSYEGGQWPSLHDWWNRIQFLRNHVSKLRALLNISDEANLTITPSAASEMTNFTSSPTLAPANQIDRKLSLDLINLEADCTRL